MFERTRSLHATLLDLAWAATSSERRQSLLEKNEALTVARHGLERAVAAYVKAPDDPVASEELSAREADFLSVLERVIGVGQAHVVEETSSTQQQAMAARLSQTVDRIRAKLEVRTRRVLAPAVLVWLCVCCVVCVCSLRLDRPFTLRLFLMFNPPLFRFCCA